MARAYLSCGSNLGDRAGYLRQAVAGLEQAAGVRVLRRSSLYETEAWGPVEQPDYLNGALLIETELPPHSLLDLCQELEQRAERKRLVRWGSRTLDIDILLYDDCRADDARLQLPHPRLGERLFVLYPLAELANGDPLPLIGDVASLLANCKDAGAVRYYAGADEW